MDDKKSYREIVNEFLKMKWRCGLETLIPSSHMNIHAIDGNDLIVVKVRGTDVTYLVNGKEISEEEFNGVDQILSCQNECTVTKEEGQTDLDYYASKEFNIFDTVSFLSNNPNWKAEHDGIEYKLTKTGELCVLLHSKEWMPQESVYVTKEVLNRMFKLIPLEEKIAEWIDCTFEEAATMIINNKSSNIRFIHEDGVDYIGNKEELFEVYYEGIQDCKWQYRKN